MIKPSVLALRVWALTILTFTIGWSVLTAILLDPTYLFTALFAGGIAGILSLPVLVVLFIAIPRIQASGIFRRNKIARLYGVNFLSTLPYGLAGAIIFPFWNGGPGIGPNFFINMLEVTACLYACACISMVLLHKSLWSYFSPAEEELLIIQQTHMETSTTSQNSYESHGSGSNKILIKGLITGGLILVLLIPASFITNLVQERQGRQKEVTDEVGSKWASSQTLMGPFLYIPFRETTIDRDGKTVVEMNQLWILPDNLEVTGKIGHELRKRSIYKVLVYHAALFDKGHFVLDIPKDIDPGSILWQDAKICFSLSDFKGIEERISIHFNGNDYELSPGLPLNDDTKGLSASINLTAADREKKIPFHLDMKLRGSEQLHFIPLAGNSSFDLQSGWPSPSFDGNALPSERATSEGGFTARWTFNKANLPFSTMLREFKIDKEALAFGVTLIQPADGYAKTNRCIKYAILFIGLTLSLFFIVELMLKKPLHPVQYVLIGLALVIFYTLLLSFSEFIDFNYSYLSASLATILLISLYAKGHFQSWRSAGIFTGVLTVLYGFIFVLIQLEDTSLLIGSIGLFIILALAMFASRKINWYGGRPVAVVQEG